MLGDLDEQRLLARGGRQIRDPAQRDNGVKLRRISPQEFRDLASVDGAVLVNSRGEVTKSGCFLRKVGEVTDAIDYERGSRHRAAEDAADAQPDAMFFVVSENRPITVFAGGRALLRRDAPVDQVLPQDTSGN